MDFFVSHLGNDTSERMNKTHQHPNFAHKLFNKYPIGTLEESHVMKDDGLNEDEQLVKLDEPYLHQVDRICIKLEFSEIDIKHGFIHFQPPLTLKRCLGSILLRI